MSEIYNPNADAVIIRHYCDRCNEEIEDEYYVIDDSMEGVQELCPNCIEEWVWERRRHI